MSPTARHHIDEFIRCLDVPVWCDETAAEWRDSTYRYLVEWYDAYLLFAIMLTELPNDVDAALSILYKRASPQRLMGLPIRIYRNKESIIGVVAIPEDAIATKRLVRLQQSLRQMFSLN